MPVKSRLIPCLFVAWQAPHTTAMCTAGRAAAQVSGPPRMASRLATLLQQPRLRCRLAGRQRPPGLRAPPRATAQQGEPGASGDAKSHPAWGWDLGAHHAAVSAAAAAATAAALAAEAAVAASGAASAAVTGLWRREQPAGAARGGAARVARLPDGLVVGAADAAAAGVGSAPAATEPGGSDAGHLGAAAPAQAGETRTAEVIAEPRAAGRAAALEELVCASAEAEHRALNNRALAQGRSSELPVSFEPAQSLQGGSLG